MAGRSGAGRHERVAGETIAVLLRAAPGSEARLTQQASLILSGEPVADLDLAIIDRGSQSEDRLRQFGQVINERNSPLIVFLTAEVTRRLTQTLGQSPKLIEELRTGKLHPAMAAFGLWKDEDDLCDLET